MTEVTAETTVAEALDGQQERSFRPDEWGYDETGFVDYVELYLADDEEGVYRWTASCTEPLAFHRNRYPELFEPFEDEDEEAGLTKEGFEAVRKVFEQRYEGCDVYEDSDGYLRFNVGATIFDGSLPLDAVDRDDLDPVIVQIYNELDPGTFGAEYVWRLVYEEWKKNREAE
jgi:hypothetical protein